MTFLKDIQRTAQELMNVTEAHATGTHTRETVERVLEEISQIENRLRESCSYHDAAVQKAERRHFHPAKGKALHATDMPPAYALAADTAMFYHPDSKENDVPLAFHEERLAGLPPELARTHRYARSIYNQASMLMHTQQSQPQENVPQ